MNIKTIKYAKANIDATAEENGITTLSTIDGERLYIVLSSGKVLEISENEILYQAQIFLESELEQVKNEY